MAVKSFEEYEKELKKSYAPQEAAALSANEQKYATEKKLTTDTYNRQIDETSKSYEDLYDENAVQRLVNEREIAENMANSGLTDSGLNRTQQTAVQLSYANSKNKINVTRQKAIDSLTASLADAITKLDIEQNDNAATIKSNYAALASSGAQDMYNNAVKEETKRIKLAQEALEKQLQAQKEASYIIKTNGGALSYGYKGSLKDNGVAVYYETDSDGNLITRYVDQNSGKTTTMGREVNPYSTGEPNKDLFTKGIYDPSKAFGNGYQPNNIKGDKLIKVGTIDLTAELGRTQNVFKTSDGKCWVWDSPSNSYAQVKKKGSGWEFI